MDPDLSWVIFAIVNSIVVPHGISDLWVYPRQDVLLIYSTCVPYVAAQHPVVILVIFLVSSVLHFAEDVGLGLASLLVCGVAELHRRGRTASAVAVMLAYMVFLHVPLHHRRVGTFASPDRLMVVTCFSNLCLGLNASRLLISREWTARVAAGVVVAHAVLNSGQKPLFTQ